MPGRPARRTALVAGASAAVAVGAAVAGTLALRRVERSLGLPSVGERAAEAALPGAEELHVATSDGAALGATMAGPESGQLFVLAHGWTLDRRLWLAVARRLVDEGHRVVLYDQRGHGASTVGSDGVTIERLAADLGAVLDHVDAEGAVVAGHSMGGMAAQAYATLQPAEAALRVGAMVLVATASSRVGAGFAVAEQLAERVIAHRGAAGAVGHPRVGPLLLRRTMGTTASADALRDMCDWFVATPAEVRAGCLSAMAGMDLTDGLRALDMDVTVVAGSRDHLLPPSRSRRIASLVPGARLVMVEGAGHMLPFEIPDQLADLLLEAATRVGTSRASGTTGQAPNIRRQRRTA